MSKYFYSPSKNAFYPVELKKDYVNAGAWPEDLIEVTNAIYHEYGDGLAPINKVRVAGDDGLPAWGKIPVDYVAKAENERRSRLEEANNVTTEWFTDLQLGVITDEDKASLILWRDYIKELKHMDLTMVEDETMFEAIKWPQTPD